MADKLPTTRWLSTGYFRASPQEGVDREHGIIRGVAVTTVGEAKGYGFSLDEEFVQETVKLGAVKRHGLKSRFGHPNMCSTALGTYLGRFRNFRLGESERDGEMRPAAIADLHLSETAQIAPAGNLYDYVLDLSEDESDMFGTSIVFTPGRYYRRNDEGEKVWDGEEGFGEIDGTTFVEIQKLHACDTVDEPAANDGLFSSFSGESIATQITEFLDLNPGVWEAIKSDPSILEAISLYADQVDEFFARYGEYRVGKKNSAGDPGEDNQEAPDMDLDTILKNEVFVALCERNGVEIPEDATEEFVFSALATANQNTQTADEALTATEFAKAEVEEMLAEADEKREALLAVQTPELLLEVRDDDFDLAKLAESDDPAVQALLAQNKEQQEELDRTGRELSERLEAELVASVEAAKAEAEEAAAEGKLNEEGVEAYAVLLSVRPAKVTVLTTDGESAAEDIDVADKARKLIESLKPNAALDIAERTVRKSGHEDQVIVVSNEKDNAELSAEKVKEHAKRMAASIGQGKKAE